MQLILCIPITESKEIMQAVKKKKNHDVMVNIVDSKPRKECNGFFKTVF